MVSLTPAATPCFLQAVLCRYQRLQYSAAECVVAGQRERGRQSRRAVQKSTSTDKHRHRQAEQRRCAEADKHSTPANIRCSQETKELSYVQEHRVLLLENWLKLISIAIITADGPKI